MLLAQEVEVGPVCAGGLERGAVLGEEIHVQGGERRLGLLVRDGGGLQVGAPPQALPRLQHLHWSRLHTPGKLQTLRTSKERKKLGKKEEKGKRLIFLRAMVEAQILHSSSRVIEKNYEGEMHTLFRAN